MKQRKWKRLLSVILAVALVCSSWTGLAVQAEDEQVVYVSASSGNDANTGAVDAPVATLAKAYALLLEGDVKENADAQGYIVVMDALAAIGDFNYNSGALTYEHAGKVVITGAYGGTTYGTAALSFDCSSVRYFQCGGPTEINNIAISNSGSKHLYVYGSTALTLASTVKVTGSVRVHGGYSYASGKTVENAQLDIACDKLVHVFGSDGMVTGNVVINVTDTKISDILSPGANNASGVNPATATVNVSGTASVGILAVIGIGSETKDMTKVTVNLNGGTVEALQRGRKKGGTLSELELNVYSADSIPGAYTATAGDKFNSAAITISGVTAELSAWTFPAADTITLTGNSVITLTAAFPTTELTVEAGSKLLLEKDTNPTLPTYTGEGTVAWISDDGGDTPQAPAVEVVYVASTGSDENDGLTADKPVATLAQAYEIIKSSSTAADETATTTIVLMDAVELTKNFIGDTDYAHKGTVKITSYYNGVDYRESGAKLRINMSGSKVIAFGGPTILEKVKFARINKNSESYVTTNLYTGPDLTLGLEVELVGGEGAEEVVANKVYRFQLRAGNYSSESGSVNIHMSSGTCYFLMAASNKYNVNGDVVITVDGNAYPWYITGGGEASGKISGTVTINVAENATVDRIYSSSTYVAGEDERCTINLTGGTVAALWGGRAADTHLKELVLNVSGDGKVPEALTLKNTKGSGTIENFTISLSEKTGTYSPDWSLVQKLIVKDDSHIAIGSLLGDVALEVETGSSVFLAYPNVTLPEWTGLNGAQEKGEVTLENRSGQLGEVLLSVDFEDGAKDSSGNGRDGVVYGDLSFVDGFDGGTAVYFDNVYGNDAQKYIDFGTLELGTEDFTISFWMKTTWGGWAEPAVNAGTAYDMSVLPEGLNHGVLLSNQNFATLDHSGFSLINAGYYLYFGSSLKTADGERYQIDSVKEPNDDRWHQVTVTVARNGMEYIYVDGTVIASVYIGPSEGYGLDAQTSAEHLILGADGLGQYGLRNTTVDNLTIYSGVMSKEQIKAEYYLNQTLSLVCELNDRGVKAGSQYDQSAIDEIMVKAETAKTTAEKNLEDGNYDLTAAEALYSDFRTAYEAFLMGKEALVSFIQLSDAHVESVGSARYEILQKALDWANELGIDAYLDSGDYSNNGMDVEIQAFWQAYMEKKGDLETFVAVGNHEVRTLASSVFSQMHINALIEAGAVEEGHDTLYYEGEVNGYHILVASDYLKDYPNYDGAQGMEKEQLQWLDEKLAEYCGQGKPVFVLIHPSVAEQLNATYTPPTTIEPESIYKIFAKYPDAIVCTGHVHHGLGDMSGVFQMEAGYYVLDIPAFRQNNSGYGLKSTEQSGAHHTGYFTFIYEDVVQFRAVDFATGEWLTAYDQVVPINVLTADVDKTELEALVEDVEAMDLSSYTDDSVSAVSEALAEAKEVLNNDDATQEQVDAAAEKLQAAVNALAEKETEAPTEETPATDAELNDLKVLVEKAKALTLSNYTDATAKAVSDALAAAQKILETDKPGQAEVLAATNSLRSALDGLVKKDASTETTSPEDNSESSSDNSGNNSGSEGTEAPGTGDNFSAGLWMSMLTLALGMIVWLYTRRKSCQQAE